MFMVCGAALICADRLLRAEQLPALGDDIRALHFGSYQVVVDPVASAHRELIERENRSRVSPMTRTCA